MGIKIFFSGIFLAFAALACSVKAQTKTPVISSEQRNQEKRIKKGIRKGQLTRSEARTLHNNTRAIAHEKQMAKADGHVSPTERRKLRRMEHNNSREIYHKRHNDKKAR